MLMVCHVYLLAHEKSHCAEANGQSGEYDRESEKEAIGEVCVGHDVSPVLLVVGHANNGSPCVSISAQQ